MPVRDTATIGAQTQMMNTALSPVTKGGEGEVVPKSKNPAPGKTSAAPMVLATASSETC